MSVSVIIAVVVAAVAVNQYGRGNVSRPLPHEASSNPSGAVWVKHCFIRWAEPRTQDTDYVGLSLLHARNLAKARGQQLVLLGAAGRCVETGSDVRYRDPVAVILDHGSSNGTIPADAIVTFADSSPEADFDGWKIQ